MASYNSYSSASSRGCVRASFSSPLGSPPALTPHHSTCLIINHPSHRLVLTHCAGRAGRAGSTAPPLRHLLQWIWPNPPHAISVPSLLILTIRKDSHLSSSHAHASKSFPDAQAEHWRWLSRLSTHNRTTPILPCSIEFSLSRAPPCAQPAHSYSQPTRKSILKPSKVPPPHKPLMCVITEYGHVTQ